MSGTEIRQLGPRDASEYQAIFLEALRSAPEAFAADYEEESARSLEEVVERFQREGIYGGFASGRLQAIATFQRQTMPKRRHVGMLWNMYVAEGQRGTGLAGKLTRSTCMSRSKMKGPGGSTRDSDSSPME